MTTEKDFKKLWESHKIQEYNELYSTISDLDRAAKYGKPKSDEYVKLDFKNIHSNVDEEEGDEGYILYSGKSRWKVDITEPSGKKTSLNVDFNFRDGAAEDDYEVNFSKRIKLKFWNRPFDSEDVSDILTNTISPANPHDVRPFTFYIIP